MVLLNIIKGYGAKTARLKSGWFTGALYLKNDNYSHVTLVRISRNPGEVQMFEHPSGRCLNQSSYGYNLDSWKNQSFLRVAHVSYVYHLKEKFEL